MENYKIVQHKLDQYLLLFTTDTKFGFEALQTFGLALFQCRNQFYGRLLRSRLIVKKKIVDLIQENLSILEQPQINNLKHYLKPLTMSSSEELNENILGLYFCLINFVKKQQVEQSKSSTKYGLFQILKIIIKQLNPLLFYFFVYRQYKKREKSISSFVIFSHNKIRSQKKIVDFDEKNKDYIGDNQENQSLLSQIQEQFSKINLSSIFQKYLKQEENSVIDSIQVCKICSQQIKLRNFEQHIKTCCKKAKMEAELKSLEDQRKKLYQQIQQYQKTIMFETVQPSQKDLNIIRILFMIKQTFLQHKKASCLRRNTQMMNSKKDPIQQIKQQIQMLEQKSQKDILLNNLIKNAQKIITAKKKLLMAQINSKTRIKSSRDSQVSFHELQQSISNARITSTGFKTKKSLFASKKNQPNQKIDLQKKTKNNKKQEVSSLSINTVSSASFTDSILNNSSNNSISSPQNTSQNSIQNCKQQKKIRNTSFITEEAAVKSKKTEQKNKQNNFKSLKILCSLDNVEEQRIGLDDFDILKFLGKGAYGKVYLVRRKATNDLYALKHIIYQSAQAEHQMKLIRKQHEIFKKIAGDHLIKAPFAFSQSCGHFFVLQFMPGGDLSKILNSEVYLEQQHAKFYLAEIVLALQYLHQCDIIHRDLKPQNIVIDKKGHIKLTDFGLSDIKIQDKLVKVKQKFNIRVKRLTVQRSVRRVALVNRTDIAKIIGTPDYIAPEIVNQTSINNYSIDWWSLGVMAYQMLVGCRPFSAMTIDQILKNILDCKIEWPLIGRQQQMMSPQAYDLISKLLDKNFQKRIGSQSCQQIKKHPFFNGIDWNNIKNQSPPIMPTIQLSQLKKYENLPEDLNLRYQIMSSNKSDKNKAKKCIGLQNFVRYDVLLQETCQSIQQKINKSRLRIKKLMTISQFIQQEQKMNLFRLEQTKFQEVAQKTQKMVDEKEPFYQQQAKKPFRKVSFNFKEIKD